MKEKKVSPLSASSKPVGTVLFHHFELVESPSQSGRVLIWESLIHCSFSHIRLDVIWSKKTASVDEADAYPWLEPKSRLALLFPLSRLPSYTVTGSQYIGKLHWNYTGRAYRIPRRVSRESCLVYFCKGPVGLLRIGYTSGVPCFPFVGIPARISMTQVCSGPK